MYSVVAGRAPLTFDPSNATLPSKFKGYMLNGGSLENLPDELCLQILGYLEGPVPLVRMSSLNKRLYQLANEDFLWRILFHKYEYTCTPAEQREEVTYKVLFRRQYVQGALICNVGSSTVFIIGYEPDRNWRTSTKYVHFQLPNQSHEHDTPSLGVVAVAATSGRNPLLSIACRGFGARIYDVTTGTSLLTLGHRSIRDITMILDKSRSDEEPPYRFSCCNISRGWEGLTDSLLVTAGRTIKIWKLRCVARSFLVGRRH